MYPTLATVGVTARDTFTCQLLHTACRVFLSVTQRREKADERLTQWPRIRKTTSEPKGAETRGIIPQYFDFHYLKLFLVAPSGMTRVVANTRANNGDMDKIANLPLTNQIRYRN